MKSKKMALICVAVSWNVSEKLDLIDGLIKVVLVVLNYFYTIVFICDKVFGLDGFWELSLS